MKSSDRKGEILIGKDILRAQFMKAPDVVRLWDSYGIPMKYKGNGNLPDILFQPAFTNASSVRADSEEGPGQTGQSGA